MGEIKTAIRMDDGNLIYLDESGLASSTITDYTQSRGIPDEVRGENASR